MLSILRTDAYNDSSKSKRLIVQRKLCYPRKTPEGNHFDQLVFNFAFHAYAASTIPGSREVLVLQYSF